MKSVNVYSFEELEKEYQDYIIDNLDDRRYQEISNEVEAWDRDAADALWSIDLNIALDFADDEDLDINEDYLLEIDLSTNNDIDWLKVFNDVQFWDDDFDIQLEFEKKGIYDFKIVRSVSPTRFEKLSRSVRKSIETYEDNVNKFATMIKDVIKAYDSYQMSEDDLRYALSDTDFEFVINKNDIPILV